jgi:hypothetical protein
MSGWLTHELDLGRECVPCRCRDNGFGQRNVGVPLAPSDGLSAKHIKVITPSARRAGNYRDEAKRVRERSAALSMPNIREHLGKIARQCEAIS